MGYCSVQDIQDDFKAVVFLARGANPSSLVSIEAVDGFINEASALIDSYVSQRWATPITADDTSLALMSLYARSLVATRVKGILQNNQQSNKDSNQNVLAAWLSVKEVLAGLTAIKNGEANLPGATLALPDGVFYSNNEANNRQPHFRKDRKQW